MSVTLRTWWDSQRNEIEGRWKTNTRDALGQNAIALGKFVEVVEKMLSIVSIDLSKTKNYRLPKFDRYHPGKWYIEYLIGKHKLRTPKDTPKNIKELWKNGTLVKDMYLNRNIYAHSNPHTDTFEEQRRKQVGFVTQCQNLIDLLYSEPDIKQSIGLHFRNLTEILDRKNELQFMGFGLLETIYKHVDYTDISNIENTIEDITKAYQRYVEAKYFINLKYYGKNGLIDLLSDVEEELGQQARVELEYKSFLEEHYTFFQKALSNKSKALKDEWSNRKETYTKVQKSESEYVVLIHTSRIPKSDQPFIMNVELLRSIGDTWCLVECPAIQTYLEIKTTPEQRATDSLTDQCLNAFDFIEVKHPELAHFFYENNALLVFCIEDRDKDDLVRLPWNENRTQMDECLSEDFKSISTMIIPSARARKRPSLTTQLNSSTSFWHLYDSPSIEYIKQQVATLKTRPFVVLTKQDGPSMTYLLNTYKPWLGIVVYTHPDSINRMESFISAQTPIELLTLFGKHNKNERHRYIATTVSFNEWLPKKRQTHTMKSF